MQQPTRSSCVDKPKAPSCPQAAWPWAKYILGNSTPQLDAKQGKTDL